MNDAQQQHYDERPRTPVRRKRRGPPSGGVSPCVEEPVHGPETNLGPQPSRQNLGGQQDPGYVRSRSIAR